MCLFDNVLCVASVVRDACVGRVESVCLNALRVPPFALPVLVVLHVLFFFVFLFVLLVFIMFFVLLC